ncbi:hypothetical protein [Bacillus testis]|uniref:hypothetical protein n=1 Tax=Bacillus testis TaxID=1622072 RepID=UPI0009464F22|nr:hypothetical protein [Bacillus testis]
MNEFQSQLQTLNLGDYYTSELVPWNQTAYSTDDSRLIGFGFGCFGCFFCFGCGGFGRCGGCGGCGRCGGCGGCGRCGRCGR